MNCDPIVLYYVIKNQFCGVLIRIKPYVKRHHIIPLSVLRQ